ncbi:MAG: zinc-binding dehydrogenase [Deltaproteobacteria bacterium]|nr:zinc-binding dehydrogenase [Deltaproteobacteria bacterium]
MRKVSIADPGGWDRLQIVEFPDPTPGVGEVLIAVEAIGVNYADVTVRMGLYSSAKKYVGWPITPGFEVAGTVAAVGDGVDDLAAGTRVMAFTRFDGYATHLVVPRRQVFETDLPVEEAASVGAVYLTAMFAVHHLAHPWAGERVLVHSAAGGVGGALVQLCHLEGCEVVGVVGSTHKVALARDLGATVIDKSTEDLWAAAERHAPEGYHVIFDANGVSTLKASWDHLATPGKLVVYGFASMLTRGRDRPSWPKLAWGWLRTPRFNPLEMTSANKSVLAFNLSYLFEEHAVLAEAMEFLVPKWADGTLKTLPVTAFAFDEVAKAHQAIESGETVGKLVLVVR